MEIFSLQNKAVWGAKNGKSCPCGRGWDSCFCAAWMFFAGELRVSARRNVINRAGGLRGGAALGRSLAGAAMRQEVCAAPCRLPAAHAASGRNIRRPGCPRPRSGKNDCALMLRAGGASGKLLHMAGVSVVHRAPCCRSPWRSCGVLALRRGFAARFAGRGWGTL